MIHKLEIDSVLLEFDSRKILSDVYLKLETGTVTGLLARNGQGKTCLMNIIHGNLNATCKSVRLDGKLISNISSKLGLVSYLPQFSFIPSGFSLKRVFDDYNINFEAFIIHFPEFTGKSNVKIINLSGGERRLLEVYIIIKSKSKFILLDEPFSHIMPLHIDKIIEIINIEKLDKGILITDHIYKQIISISDNIYVLSDCKTHFVKHPDDIERLGYLRF